MCFGLPSNAVEIIRPESLVASRGFLTIPKRLAVLGVGKRQTRERTLERQKDSRLRLIRELERIADVRLRLNCKRQSQLFAGSNQFQVKPIWTQYDIEPDLQFFEID
jgi:hypothetical protein